MKCTKKGRNSKITIWKGSCRQCGAEFEAERCELNVERCPREGYEFAHANCVECGSFAGNSLILYPQKTS